MHTSVSVDSTALHATALQLLRRGTVVAIVKRHHRFSRLASQSAEQAGTASYRVSLAVYVQRCLHD